MRLPPFLLALAALAAGPLQAGATQIALTPSRDNTLYETSGGDVSNGKGVHCFAGVNGSGDRRRPLLAFDVAAVVPAGSVITGAQLQLHMSKSGTGPFDVALHAVLADWGEGTSDAPGEEGGGAPATAGDADWVHRFHPNDAWTAPGGDFVATASATTTVDAVGYYTWGTTAALVADAQAWLDQPSTNQGWIVIGDESGVNSTKRFDTRENAAGVQPVLTLTFTPPCGSGTPSAEVVRLGSPPNPAALLPGVTTGPVVGLTWDPVVDHTSFVPASILDTLGVSASSTNLVLPGLGTLLCDPTTPTYVFSATPGSAFAVELPPNCNLVGLSLCAQAASYDGASVSLTNALDVTVGNS